MKTHGNIILLIFIIILIICLFLYIITNISNKNNYNSKYINKLNNLHNKLTLKNIMITDLYLVITTCKNYYSNIKDLIIQLDKFDFPKEKILIISGQEDEDSIHYENNIKIIKVKYSGLHLTGCIYINENINSYPDAKYWILLPDTIKFGDNFFTNIYKIYNELKDNNIYSIPFINPKIRPTMDMGIVKTEHIINMGDYLNKIKTFNIDKDNLIVLKRQLILDEDIIFGLNPRCKGSTKHNSKILETKQIKFITNELKYIEEKRINNNKINQVYLTLLDLYKFQRNFTGPDSKLVIEL